MAIKGLFTTSLITPNQGGRVSTGPAPTPEGTAPTARDVERVQLSRPGLGGLLLIGIVLGSGSGLAWWKHTAIAERNAASLSQPEPMESVTAAVAQEREHRPTTTSIGTVLALRSITLRNELPGTVREVRLAPGQIVEAGTVLVALDVSVEEAELKAQEAQAALARDAARRASQRAEREARRVARWRSISARAERDVALAQIARTKAIIARKTIRAPFRARVGIADVHPGQYLNEGTAAHDAAGRRRRRARRLHRRAARRRGAAHGRHASRSSRPATRAPIAGDDRRDRRARRSRRRATRWCARGSTTRRARRRRARRCASRCRSGRRATAVAVPVSALRKGPGGDHVFVLAPDEDGKPRAHVRPVQSGAVLGDEVLILERARPPASRSPPRARSSCARPCWSRSRRDRQPRRADRG